ncbi:hypothetical protein [Spirosoma lituiforme]
MNVSTKLQLFGFSLLSTVDWRFVRRQDARAEGGFAAQPNEGIKVDVTFVILSSVIIHQPSRALGGHNRG